MDLLACLGIIVILKYLYDNCTKSHHIFTSDELDAMNMEMVGKSTKECRQILKKYSK